MAAFALARALRAGDTVFASWCMLESPIAAEVIYVSAPSAYPTNPALTNYRKLTRPLWPRVDDPWKAD